MLGVYLPPPSGMAPSPGWGDKCVEEALRIAWGVRPPLRAIDLAGGLRLMSVPASVEPETSFWRALPG